MHHLPMIDSARRAFRVNFCTVCSQRPPGSEGLGPDVARECEPRCSLFMYIGQLKQIAETPHALRPGDYEDAIRSQICNQCCLKPTAGDYCADRLAQSCPLTLFARPAVAILEAMVVGEQTAKHRAEHESH